MSGSGIVLTILAAVLTMCANLGVRLGIDRAGGFDASLSTLHKAVFHLFMQPVFSLGMTAYVIATLVWFKVVATEPLSLAYPIMVSVTFILVTSAAVIMLNEPITAKKSLGLVIILAGIFLVSSGGS